MKNITKPSNPVNLDSGQRRDLDEIIKSLRKDITIPDNRDTDAPTEAEVEQSENMEQAGRKRTRSLLGRARALRLGLMGTAMRVPA
jgi:hypothetical protein